MAIEISRHLYLWIVRSATKMLRVDEGRANWKVKYNHVTLIRYIKSLCTLQRVRER